MCISARCAEPPRPISVSLAHFQGAYTCAAARYVCIGAEAMDERSLLFLFFFFLVVVLMFELGPYPR
jgi:hypothetical protein